MSYVFFFSSRRRHTRSLCDWSSDVCSSDLAMEVALDGECSQVIVRRQPAANDLRLIVAITKTVTDLERIGDEAQKIARMAKSIHERGLDRRAPRTVHVRHAAGRALAMLRSGPDA